MRKEDLDLAVNIKKEIDELEGFISSAEKIWTRKLVRMESKYLFKYANFNRREVELSEDMKNKIIVLIKEHLKELYEKLEQL